MIFHDLDINIPDFKKSAELRSRCGADIILSTKSMPPNTESMIKKHAENGCIFYRVLSNQQLLDISKEQLLFNLSKMLSFGVSTWQCILVVDDHRDILNYESYVSKVNAWVDHGGSSMSTYGNPISSFIKNRYAEYVDSIGKRSILIPQFAPRRNIEVIKDWTLTLATFPGVGLSGAETIRKIINNNNLGDDLLTAIWFITDYQEMEKATGEWKELRRKAREWLGLSSTFDIDITVKTKEVDNG